MKLCLSLIASLLVATGCKTDGAESTAGSAAPQAEQSASKGRSGKIDLPPQQRPRAGDGDRPAPPDEEDPGDDRRARREERRKERMAELDKDGDGQISDAERDAARQVRMAETKKRLDTDGDGKLTVAELKASRMARRLGDEIDGIDADKNGEISAEELQKSMDTMRATMWGGRRGGRFGGDAAPAAPNDSTKTP
jgi:Ca2+-binding EF-hand superfamily protein